LRKEKQMTATIIRGEAPGGKRSRLVNQLPLAAPILLQFFPIYACNFRCKYCTFSIPKRQRNFISDRIRMDFSLYKKCIDGALELPGRIKVIRFVGMGEPLMHTQLPDMIAYAREKNAADRLEILTNGSLLTHALSARLIGAGLSRMIVSLQGITRQKYMEMSEANIDPKNIALNLKYFYDHKKETHVYVKIIDLALDDEKDEQTFYEMFGDVCDSIGVEHAGPLYPGVDYDMVLSGRDLSQTQFGLHVKDINVCPQSFFTMQINPDGKVVPCYSIVYPEILGDCNRQSIGEIWNGEAFNAFRLKMLNGTRSVCQTCAECNIAKYRRFPEDDISGDVEQVRRLYSEQ
jgi:radical SAM protein with 4Fe4S-binding SPASM domain